MVEWRRVPGYGDRYDVSDDGRVRGYRGGRYCTLFSDGPRELRPGLRSGYKYVTLYLNGAQKHRKIHELILMAFVGPKPEGQLCRHLDDVKLNNVLSNLAYGTYVDNFADSRRNGRLSMGERHGTAKLKAKEVIKIRSDFALGIMGKDLAARYGVSRATVSNIVNNKCWSAEALTK